ncbi:ISPg5 transposase Orf2 [Porphyromonas gingivalis]|nr:ISPg5 transposase Orf2 [Porphyromonas gingivalis]SJL32341.1 ISPg5 transposase Orf2 [Porphyromonas gingivalis]
MQIILSEAKNPLLIPPEDLPRISPKLYRKMTPRQRADLAAVNRKSS